MDDVLRRFLSAFNEVEQFLIRLSPKGERQSFSWLVSQGSEKNLNVKKLSFTLREFGDLRNAIMQAHRL